MHLILFLVGIVLVFAGAVLIHSSVPVSDIPEAARFNSGIIAVVGGLILMALAAVVRSVGRIAERFEMQPLPLPPVAAVGREDPAPRPARAAPNGEAKRSSLLSWFGHASAPANAPNGAAKPPPAAPDVPAAAQVDLAPLTRIPEEPRVAVPPPLAAPPVAAPSIAAPPAPKPPPPPLRPPVKPAAPAATSPDVTVYKSGVIDGMAYTLFMDGSIEAELPQGKVRFASVDELQKYLTTRQ
jgi:hypothetical protein